MDAIQSNRTDKSRVIETADADASYLIDITVAFNYTVEAVFMGNPCLPHVPTRGNYDAMHEM